MPSDEIVSKLVAVDRVASDLRRGLPSVVGNQTDEGATLIAAAEMISAESLKRLAAISGGPVSLVLTLERAMTFKILPSHDTTVRIPLNERITPSVIQSLADPTQDLADPMRGPFERVMEPDRAGNVAGIKLTKIARLLPAIVSAPILADEAGKTFAAARNLLFVDADEVLSYDIASAQALKAVTHARVPLLNAENTRVHAFRPDDGGIEHLALVIGDPPRDTPPLVRIHSDCFTGDLLGSLKCDCGEQLKGAIREIGKAGAGILIYLSQEGRGIGLINKLRAYELQDQGFDTVEANERLGFPNDERIYLPAAQIIRALGHTEVRLLTNNPLKIEGLESHGIRVTERVSHSFPANQHNEFYLSTKAKRSGHLL